MGAGNVRFISDPGQQKQAFGNVLADIEKLEHLINEGRLERNIPRLGVEKEMYFIDKSLRPAPIISEFLKTANEKCYASELAKFNLEINLKPLEISGDCLSELEKKLNSHIEKARKICRDVGEFDLIYAGILPTIRKMDLELDNLTPNDRAKSMIEAMKEMRDRNYPIQINGMEELRTMDFSHMFQSCNTSFQIHYQVNPEDFVAKYNFAQAIAAPVLAAASNSAILFGKRLWHETRIALFQQAVDTRPNTAHLNEENLRVPFGEEWLEGSVLKLYRDNLADFRIFLKYAGEENDGNTPNLMHMNVFNGSVFRWTRACYGISDSKPHLRIENRLLPSGPTIKDEVANTAFWIGLMHGMPEEYRELPERMSFDHAKINLLKTARYGLGSEVMWLDKKRFNTADLILNVLLPIAEEGLKKANIEEKDRKYYLGIIKDRIESRQTGSQWMFNSWENMEGHSSEDSKCIELSRLIYRNQRKGDPVHTWNRRSGNFKPEYKTVGDCMSTALYTVKPDDLPEQVGFKMIREGYHYAPVADSDGQVRGLIRITDLLEHKLKEEKNGQELQIADILRTDIRTVSPEISIQEAVEIMKNQHIKCLPVVHNDRLTGIFTEFDVLEIAHLLLENKDISNGKSKT